MPARRGHYAQITIEVSPLGPAARAPDRNPSSGERGGAFLGFSQGRGKDTRVHRECEGKGQRVANSFWEDSEEAETLP